MLGNLKYLSGIFLRIDQFTGTPHLSNSVLKMTDIKFLFVLCVSEQSRGSPRHCVAADNHNFRGSMGRKKVGFPAVPCAVGVSEQTHLPSFFILFYFCL